MSDTSAPITDYSHLLAALAALPPVKPGHVRV
jgi:hypothetical protein